MSADERSSRQKKNNISGLASASKKDVELVESSASLDTVILTLNKRFDDTNSKIASMKDELNAKLDGIKLHLQQQIDNIKSEICKHKSSCRSESQAIRSEIDSVHRRMDMASEAINRVEHRTELIAVGIPYIFSEYLSNHVSIMARAIGFDENKTSHIIALQKFVRRRPVFHPAAVLHGLSER